MTCPSCQAANAPDDEACFKCGRSLSALTEGFVLDGRYTILGRIGRGGMGTVYKAHDRTLDEDVAIKVLRPELARDPEIARRFRSEIKLARKVTHSNVCRIHDYGEDGHIQYISMEFVDGTNLHNLIQQSGPLPALEAFDAAIAVAEGLAAIHKQDIVHRDVKAANIMRDRRGVVRLMDFGIAKAWSSSTALTATGETLGTPEYMSPEQFSGHPVDSRSDLYALGCVIFELFTGQPPFRGDSPWATCQMHLHEPPPLAGPACAAIPEPVLALLRQLLEKNPEARLPRARDAKVALEDARARHRASAPSGTEATLTTPVALSVQPDVRSPLSSGRTPRRRLAIPVALGALVVGAGALGLVGRSPVTSPGAAEARSPATTAPTLALAVSPSPLSPVLVVAPKTEHTTPAGMGPTQASRDLGTHKERPAPQGAAVALVPTATPEAPQAPNAGRTEPSEGQPQGTGTLEVASKPWSSVTLDGRPLGHTPIAALAIEVGEHTLVLEHPKYGVAKRSVTIKPGQTSSVFVDLTEHP